jgi:ribosomal protein S18 acetylase RimI-like enzyme
LVGFISQTDPTLAYIHFVGVDPLERASGLGRGLYEHFFEIVQALGCHSVRCVTSPVNLVSIAFHRRMGFEFLTGDTEQNNVPVHTDFDGLGGSRVSFRRDLHRP